MRKKKRYQHGRHTSFIFDIYSIIIRCSLDDGFSLNIRWLKSRYISCKRFSNDCSATIKSSLNRYHLKKSIT